MSVVVGPDGQRRIVFIGINAGFSQRHLLALAATHGVLAVIETVMTLSPLKRLKRVFRPSLLARAARVADAGFHEIGHRDKAALSRLLRRLEPDLVVVAGMGWLLDRDALAIPRLGTVNVHPTLLPSYRGANPIFWQLFDGVAESGVSAHLVDPYEDRGPIVRQANFPVPPGTTLAEFLAQQIEIGPPLLVAAVRDLLAGTAQPIPQPAASPTRRAVRLHAADPALTAWADWDLERAWRVLRGVGPLLGCPPPLWRDLGRLAYVTAKSAQPSWLPPGHIGRDAKGLFLAHPQGRLYLRYRWLPRAWLLALRLRGAPANGITTAEKLAGPAW